MHIHIAGGIGEHGRNSLYIQGDTLSFLVDCGLMTGDADPNPRLSQEQIRSARYLLLTHSHQDHSGAYPWLKENGFAGTVIASAATLEQLRFPVDHAVTIQPGQELKLPQDLSIRCGRSGHAIGSLWFEVDLEDKRLLFSGDYTEDTLLYACDKLRGRWANLAFLDSARDSSLGSAEVLQARLLKLVSDTVLSGRPVILPVPRHGRGLELMQLLSGRGHIRLDEASQKEKDSIPRYPEWFKTQLKESFSLGGSIYFIADTQLKQPGNRVLCERLLHEDAQIIFTGHVQEGSFAMRLLKMGQATVIPYPTHASDRTVDLLGGVNDFEQVVRTHTARHQSPGDIRL